MSDAVDTESLDAMVRMDAADCEDIGKESSIGDIGNTVSDVPSVLPAEQVEEKSDDLIVEDAAEASRTEESTSDGDSFEAVAADAEQIEHTSQEELVVEALQLEAGHPNDCPAENGIINDENQNTDVQRTEHDWASMSQRSFSISGFRQPGGWRSNSEIVGLMNRCESFTVQFNKPDKPRGLKSGSIEYVFESVIAAREAFDRVQSLNVDGLEVSVRASDAFFLPASCSTKSFFTVPEDESVSSRTIYALNLLATANKDLIDGILGADAIESVSFLPLDDESQQAEIRMHSPESASSARQDVNGFELDDGRHTAIMRVCTSDEYRAYVAEEEKPRPFAMKPKKSVEKVAPVIQKQDVPVASAPEVDEDEITDAFLKHIEEQRINWAELNDKEELYEICDTISAKYGGLPDSILKQAMLQTLQRHLGERPEHWLAEHLQTLIQLWKKEVMSEVVYNRETQVQMSAPEYQPVPESRKRKHAASSSRAGRVKMGVAALLQSVRKCAFETENGKVDVDEDDSGNILIGGEELSFESWAKFNQTSQPDVVSMVKSNPNGKAAGEAQGSAAKKFKPEIHDFKLLKKQRQEKYEKKMGYKKMKIMKKAREEMEALERQEQEFERAAAGEEKAEAAAPPKPPKELDEGEIDSDAEREAAEKEKKRKQQQKQSSSSNSNNSDSSESSSSSSSESDQDESSNVDSRRRRRHRRKQDRRKPVASYNPMIIGLYENRHLLVAALPLEQKTAFAAILNQMTSQTGGVSSTQQQNTMQMFSDAFSNMR